MWIHLIGMFLKCLIVFTGEQSQRVGVPGGPLHPAQTLLQLRCGPQTDLPQVSDFFSFLNE